MKFKKNLLCLLLLAFLGNQVILANSSSNLSSFDRDSVNAGSFWDSAFTGISYEKKDYIRVNLDGEEIVFDIKPQIVNGRTLVPIRAIFEAMGLKVTWDEANQIAHGSKPGFNINFKIDSKIVNVNSIDTEIDIPAMVINGRTMIPLRFLSESMGYNIVWVEASSLILLSQGQIDEWRYGGTESISPYREYEIRFSNGTRTNLTRLIPLQPKEEKLKLTPVYMELFIDSHEYITVELTGTDESNSSVKWVSSNSKIASIENGRVIGLSPGKAVITALTPDGYKATCDVKVAVKINATVEGVFFLIREMIINLSDGISQAIEDIENSNLRRANAYMLFVQHEVDLMRDFCKKNPYTSTDSIIEALDNIEENAIVSQSKIQLLEEKGLNDSTFDDVKNAINPILDASKNLTAFVDAFPEATFYDPTVTKGLQYYLGGNVPTYECVVVEDCKYTLFNLNNEMTRKEGHADFGDIYVYSYDEKYVNYYILAMRFLGWNLFEESPYQDGIQYSFERQEHRFALVTLPSSGIFYILPKS